MVSTYLSTLLSGTHSSQLKKNFKKSNDHSKHYIIAFYTQQSIKSFTEFETELCFRIKSWTGTTESVNYQTHSPLTEAVMIFLGKCNPQSFPKSFPNLKDGQFRREGTVFNLKEASQENKNFLHLLNYGTPVAITIL